MRILIADDHTVAREGVKRILEELNIASIIVEAKDGTEALRKIKTENFDFVILDISMPGLNGLDILQALKPVNEKVNVLILSFYSDIQYAVRALRLGASGYLSKDSTREELALAIKKISAGGRYISSDVSIKLVSDLNNKTDIPLHIRLSEREFQIMCFLAKGVPINEIGKKLCISDNTVSTYRTRLLKKLGMISNSELALYAFKNNLIE